MNAQFLKISVFPQLYSTCKKSSRCKRSQAAESLFTVYTSMCKFHLEWELLLFLSMGICPVNLSGGDFQTVCLRWVVSAVVLTGEHVLLPSPSQPLWTRSTCSAPGNTTRFNKWLDSGRLLWSAQTHTSHGFRPHFPLPHSLLSPISLEQISPSPAWDDMNQTMDSLHSRLRPWEKMWQIVHAAAETFDKITASRVGGTLTVFLTIRLL